MTVTIKTGAEIEGMRVAGRLGSEVLDYITPFVKPGVTTGELDRLCHDYMVDVQGTIPAPLNYAPNGHTPHPKSICTDAGIEVLAPDFRGDREALVTVLEAAPEVFNHNIETVPRLFPRLRPQGRYALSLEVLRAAKHIRPGQATKSGLMVGLGETDEEVFSVLADLRAAGVDIVTIGQYLRPTREHEPVHRYLEPAAFRAIEDEARAIGFPTVYSGVFVRSSFNAEEVYRGGGVP